MNNLRDNPMTQFSFEWIVSLNCLCQQWGQVHAFREPPASGFARLYRAGVWNMGVWNMDKSWIGIVLTYRTAVVHDFGIPDCPSIQIGAIRSKANLSKIEPVRHRAFFR